MYQVVSIAFSPMCLPRTLPRMRSSEPAQTEMKHTKTPRSSRRIWALSTEVSSSESVTRPAHATPTKTTAASEPRICGKAPGRISPITACMASVTRGKQVRMTRFSEMAMRERLKLLSPMLAAKDRDKHNTATTCTGDAKRFLSHGQFAAQDTAKKRLMATKATTCWAAVIRKAAGMPCKPSSFDTVASQRTSFMKRLRPDCAPK
mmetsp:Transcript_130209/g.404998  ORF Transcript_130209/g.404998 Transcript_130209/m.404998 type:complete len:205 (+) Transcript_130209:601-1215(+)